MDLNIVKKLRTLPHWALFLIVTGILCLLGGVLAILLRKFLRKKEPREEPQNESNLEFVE